MLCGSDGKESACNAGDTGHNSRHNGNPPQYSCLDNLMDSGGCWATVYRVARSQPQLSTLVNCEQ